MRLHLKPLCTRNHRPGARKGVHLGTEPSLAGEHKTWATSTTGRLAIEDQQAAVTRTDLVPRRSGWLHAAPRRSSTRYREPTGSARPAAVASIGVDPLIRVNT